MKTTVLKQVHTAVQQYVNKQLSYSTGVYVCAIYSLLGTPAYMLYLVYVIVMWNQTLYYLSLQMMIPLLLCCQQGEEPTKRRMEYGTVGETPMPLSKCGCFGSAA